MTLQVNTTRQDVRITKQRLHEEARQNREAQKSLLKWAADIEQERQLLYEAIAYLNDDVQSSTPDIEKMQLDLRRLRDFIAYKVAHADEERDQYVFKSPIQKDDFRASFGESEIDLDSSRTSSVFYNHQQKEEEYRIKMKELNDEISDREVRAMLKTAEELKTNLEQSEVEAASLIGRIVAEKESLKADRDTLLIQLNTAMCTESSSQEMIKSLRKLLSEAHTEVVCLNSVREKASLKEVELTEGYEHAAEQIFQLTNELDKTNCVLSNSMRMTETLGQKFVTLENDLKNEKLLRENDKTALKASLKEIEDLTIKINDSKEKEKEKGEYLNRIRNLEREILHMKTKNLSYEEESDLLREKLLSYHEKVENQKEEIYELKNEIRENIKNEKELLFLAEEANELKLKLNVSANEAEMVSAIRVEKSEKEIDELTSKLELSDNELKLKNNTILSLESSIASLKLHIEEENIKKAHSVIDLKRNEKTENELSISLKQNKELNDEIISLREQLKLEQIRCLSLENSPKEMLLKSKQVSESIEISKNTLYQAALQIDNVRTQVLTAEKKISRCELEIKKLKIDILKGKEREESMKLNLNSAKNQNDNEIQIFVEKEKERQIENERVLVQKNVMISTLQSSLEDMKEELERMEQLKEISDTKFAALSLIGNGSRVLEAVEQLKYGNMNSHNDNYNRYHSDNNNNNYDNDNNNSNNNYDNNNNNINNNNSNNQKNGNSSNNNISLENLVRSSSLSSTNSQHDKQSEKLEKYQHQSTNSSQYSSRNSVVGIENSMSGGRNDLNNVINRSNSSNKDDKDLNTHKYLNDIIQISPAS